MRISLLRQKRQKSFLIICWQTLLVANFIMIIIAIRGGIKKKKLFFFRKTPKGGEGGLAESKISLSEKTEIFLEFFLQRGGVSPIPKGCYHKKLGILGYFCQKGRPYRFYQKKTQNISDFFSKTLMRKIGRKNFIFHEEKKLSFRTFYDNTLLE